MRFRLLILWCVIIFCTMCKKGEVTLVKVDPIIPLPIAVTNVNNDLVLKFVNDNRTAGCKCGSDIMPPVPKLTWNNALAVVASRHSVDMSSNKFISHISSNGSTLKDRVNLAGYKYLLVGENLASGTFTEQTVVEAWIASPEHCKNIMSADYKDVGVAREGMYWTQNFGRLQPN